MAAIRTNGLTKRFGGTAAIDDLDLVVEEGEVFGFLGPNGAGKSTTIDVLLDLVRPTAGSATVLGHDAQAESREVRARTGVLPDQYAVFPHHTGRQHVRDRVDAKDADDDPLDVLERVGIEDAADRSASDYSRGMKQRLVLGMALVGEPDLLLLDEPSTGLDPNGVRELRTIVREEADRGATVFFSSHNLEQVEAVCDRVGVLRDGQLVATDTIDGLRDAAGLGGRFSVAVDRVTDAAIQRVEAVDGVERVSVDEQAGTLSVAPAEGVQSEVLEELHAADVAVESFEVDEPSLEDLFAALTTDAADEDGGARAPVQGEP